MNWRPIKTAPKDGTNILLSYPRFDGEGNIVTQGRWIESLPYHAEVEKMIFGELNAVSLRRKSGWFVGYVTEFEHGGRQFNGRSFDASGCFVEPTHWQPLPTPRK